MIKHLLISAYIILCTAFISTAQIISKGRETKKTVVNVSELSNYYKEHPENIVRKPLFDEDEHEERHPEIPDPALVHYRTNNTTEQRAAHSALLPASPAPNDTFESTPSNLSSIPPDTHGAVDSQYCLTAINTAVHIQSRTGANIMSFGIDGFWSSLLTAGPGAFDPRVHYDPFYKRWIMVCDAYGQSANSQIMIAVSQTNNPTGLWNMYSVTVDGTGAYWLDFPCVGFNKKWITVTGNMFPNSTGGGGPAVVYVFDYASIMAGTGAPYTKFTQTSSFTICPALTYDTTQNNMFAVEINDNTTGTLKLWKISGAVGSETMSVVGYPGTSQHWRSNAPGYGDFTPQVASTHKMDAGDDRITSCTYRNHKIWCSHTVFLPATGTANRCSVMWWQVDTTAHPLQTGLIDDPSHTKFYDYSSIAVNRNDDALVGFGCFSSSLHPSAGYALHMHTDPTDSIRPVVIFRHGLAPYYETFGGTLDRWGDYSNTCIDPRNDSDFWTIQESSTVGSSPNWDTWWANVQICPKPNEPVMAYSKTSICSRDTGNYIINSIPGATSYVWYVTGTGWGIASGIYDTSILLIAGTGVATITVLAYNSCGEGAAHTFTITPFTFPVAPTVATYSPACVGSPTAIFTVTSIGASSYTWAAYGTGWSGTSSSTSFTAGVGTGTGTIVCTPYNFCGMGTPDTLLVTPGIYPVASFAEALHSTFTAINDTITFTGTVTGTCTYNWNFGGGAGTPGTGAGPQIVNWAIPGLKTITLTVDNNGCTSNIYTDTVLVLQNTGVSILNYDNSEITILPNPNDGIFQLNFGKELNTTVEVKLIDLQGNTVYSNKYNGTINQKIAVNTVHVATGIYTLLIIADEKTVTKKIDIIK